MEHEHGLTPQEYKNLVDIFNTYDKDGDGHVTAVELRETLLACGMHKCDIETAQRIVERYDTDKSSTIELGEFVKMIAPKIKTKKTVTSVKEDVLREAFERFDTNGDHYISKTELREVFKKFSQNATPECLDLMVEQAFEDDTDGDGRINYNEFMAMYTADACSK